MKKYFALYLRPPRPSFSQDMPPEERAIMQQHVAYWTGLMSPAGKINTYEYFPMMAVTPKKGMP